MMLLNVDDDDDTVHTHIYRNVEWFLLAVNAHYTQHEKLLGEKKYLYTNIGQKMIYVLSCLFGAVVVVYYQK